MQMSMRKLNSHTILQLWCCINFCILALGSGHAPSVSVRVRVRVSVSFSSKTFCESEITGGLLEYLLLLMTWKITVKTHRNLVNSDRTIRV